MTGGPGEGTVVAVNLATPFPTPKNPRKGPAGLGQGRSMGGLFILLFKADQTDTFYMPKPNLVAIGETQQPNTLPKYEVEIVDESDPRSVVNIVPKVVSEAIKRVAKEWPHYLVESEVELQYLLKPSELDDRMRVAFWAEYQRAQDAGTKMVMKNVFGQLVSKQFFHATFIVNPSRVAWMIKPIEEYMISSEASLQNGKNTMSKIMRMEVFDKDGNIKVKEAGIFLKAYELLENRVRGAVVQKTMNAHMHAKVSDENADAAREELEELKSKRSAVEVIDIEVSQTSNE